MGEWTPFLCGFILHYEVIIRTETMKDIQKQSKVVMVIVGKAVAVSNMVKY